MDYPKCDICASEHPAGIRLSFTLEHEVLLDSEPDVDEYGVTTEARQEVAILFVCRMCVTHLQSPGESWGINARRGDHADESQGEWGLRKAKSSQTVARDLAKWAADGLRRCWAAVIAEKQSSGRRPFARAIRSCRWLGGSYKRTEKLEDEAIIAARGRVT